MITKPTDSRKKPSAVKYTDKQFTTRDDVEKSFLDHVNELRTRFAWATLAIVGASVLAYVFNPYLTAIIQRPFGQTLYFTSPVGGLNFLIKLSVTFGFIVALPVLLFQVAKFFAPILEKAHKRSLSKYVIWSIILAYGGVVFAYFVSLPSALHFLTSFNTENITALITANEYYDFVLAYLLGYAVLFQIPLVVLFINKIKPLTPGGMMGAQRYIILASFVVAAILTPTPDPVNQTIMALPAVLLYQVAAFLVWKVSRASGVVPAIYFEEIPQDLVATPLPETESHLPVTPTVPLASAAVTRPVRPARYFDTIVPAAHRAPSEVLVERREISRNSAARHRSQSRSSAVRSMDIILPSPVQAA